MMSILKKKKLKPGHILLLFLAAILPTLILGGHTKSTNSEHMQTVAPIAP